MDAVTAAPIRSGSGVSTAFTVTTSGAKARQTAQSTGPVDPQNSHMVHLSCQGQAARPGTIRPGASAPRVVSVVDVEDANQIPECPPVNVDDRKRRPEISRQIGQQ